MTRFTCGWVPWLSSLLVVLLLSCHAPPQTYHSEIQLEPAILSQCTGYGGEPFVLDSPKLLTVYFDDRACDLCLSETLKHLRETALDQTQVVALTRNIDQGTLRGYRKIGLLPWPIMIAEHQPLPYHRPIVLHFQDFDTSTSLVYFPEMSDHLNDDLRAFSAHLEKIQSL